MHIFFGSDHNGHSIEPELREFTKTLGHTVESFSNNTLDPTDDYPDFALAVAEAVIATKDSFGIVICGSGGGVSVAANKVPGIRAILCYTPDQASYARRDDNANVLALGARYTDVESLKLMIKNFLETPFATEERYKRRLDKVNAIEHKYTHL